MQGGGGQKSRRRNSIIPPRRYVSVFGTIVCVVDVVSVACFQLIGCILVFYYLLVKSLFVHGTGGCSDVVVQRLVVVI